MDEQLHSPARRLIELRIAHAELDGRIDALMGAVRADVVADISPVPAIGAIAAIAGERGPAARRRADAAPVEEATPGAARRDRAARTGQRSR